jgi:hypothetical protein
MQSIDGGRSRAHQSELPGNSGSLPQRAPGSRYRRLSSPFWPGPQCDDLFNTVNPFGGRYNRQISSSLS